MIYLEILAIWIVLTYGLCYINYCASVVSGNDQDPDRDAGQ